MSFARSKVWTLLILSLTAGCWLDPDPAIGVDPSTTSEDGGEPGDDSGGNSPGETNGSTDSGMSIPPTDDDSGPVGSLDSGIEMDASGGTNGDPTDAGNGTTEVDAGHDSGTEVVDAGHDSGTEVVDAGHDSGTEVVDAGHDSGTEVVDAGPPPPPPPVVPDLGAADMPDADRANLIHKIMKDQGYLENWFPVLQSSGEIRPLLLAPSHGSAVRVRQNPVAYQAIDAWDDALPLPIRMPNGSIFVKDMFKLDPMTNQNVYNGSLVMAKIDALDPAKYEGNWFFVRITTANIPATPYSTTCIGCHNGKTGKAAWPPNPSIPGDLGGKKDGLVPWDYLYIPFCYDQTSTQCVGPR